MIRLSYTTYVSIVFGVILLELQSNAVRAGVLIQRCLSWFISWRGPAADASTAVSYIYQLIEAQAALVFRAHWTVPALRASISLQVRTFAKAVILACSFYYGGPVIVIAS